MKTHFKDDKLYQPILIKLNSTTILQLNINSNIYVCIILNFQLKDLLFHLSNNTTNSFFFI